jgi:biopolymer transport protein ExbD
MIMSRRAQRMERHHKRSGRSAGINLVSLMDIFTILVFFLLVNSSDGEVLPTQKSVNLPESVAEDKPRETLVVMITATDIIINGESVGSIETLLGESADAPRRLRAALETYGRETLPSAVGSESGRREVTIMGDRDIPYRVLKQAMAACSQAGYGRISLAVLQKTLRDG